MSSNVQLPTTGNGRVNSIIMPSNNPSNNAFSHQGNNIVQFQLPNSNVILDPQSIRINGTLRLKNPSGLAQFVKDNTHMDKYCGVNSIFSSVQWSSSGGNRSSIEKINNYPQLLSSILPALTSTSQYNSEASIQTLSTENTKYQDKSIIKNIMTEAGAKFSTPIYTGLTMSSSNRIPLLPLKGLTLTLELNADDAVFIYDDTNATTTQKPYKSQVVFELFNVSLSCTMYHPNSEEKMAIANMKQGSLSMNTFTSLFSVLQSSDNNTQFNLGIRNLVACFFKLVPTNKINHQGHNEFQSLRVQDKTGQTKQFLKASFLRSGVEFPLYFPINIPDKSLECQLNKYYLSALNQLHDAEKRISIDGLMNDPRFAIGCGSAYDSSDIKNQLSSQNKSNVVYGIGYDYFSSFSGADFDGKPLTLNLESSLDDGNTNAMYCFVLAQTVVNFDQNGIQVTF